MLIKYGYGIAIALPQPTPLVTLLDVREERRGDVTEESDFVTTPQVPVSIYRDQFGNMCRRTVAPTGDFAITLGGTILDTGAPDPVDPSAGEVPVAELPDDVLVYLLSSRYCEVDRMGAFAWQQFGPAEPGWRRVQAIVDFVHRHLSFGYHHARDTRTAFDAFTERVGVCRDFAHLTITFCRALNIPARYVNGYLGDIGVPKNPAPMDFSAWCEVYLGGRWYAFDARHNRPRIGRIPVAYGRDATDVPLMHSFGQHVLKSFKVWTDEVEAEATPASERAA